MTAPSLFVPSPARLLPNLTKFWHAGESGWCNSSPEQNAACMQQCLRKPSPAQLKRPQFSSWNAHRLALYMEFEHNSVGVGRGGGAGLELLRVDVQWHQPQTVREHLLCHL